MMRKGKEKEGLLARRGEGGRDKEEKWLKRKGRRKEGLLARRDKNGESHHRGEEHIDEIGG